MLVRRSWVAWEEVVEADRMTQEVEVEVEDQKRTGKEEEVVVVDQKRKGMEEVVEVAAAVLLQLRWVEWEPIERSGVVEEELYCCGLGEAVEEVEGCKPEKEAAALLSVVTVAVVLQRESLDSEAEGALALDWGEGEEPTTSVLP